MSEGFKDFYVLLFLCLFYLSLALSGRGVAAHQIYTSGSLVVDFSPDRYDRPPFERNRRLSVNIHS